MKPSPDRILPVDGGDLSRTALAQRLFPSITFELTQIAAALSIESAAASRWRTRPTPDLEEARNAERRATVQIARAASLMRDVAALGGPFSSKITDVSVSELMGQSIAVARHALHQAGASVTIRLPHDLADMQADRVLAQQILLELLLNAVAGSTPQDDPSSIEVGAHRDGDFIYISIVPATAAAGRTSRALPPELGTVAVQAGGSLDPSARDGTAFVLSFPVICSEAESLGDRVGRGSSSGVQPARSQA